ncbi:MAG: EAL domain-containing protein [Candidatus Limnocylindrales bacterium]
MQLWTAATSTLGGSTPALYSLLAIGFSVSVLVQVAMLALDGDPDALVTAIWMTGFSGVLVAARRLAIQGREAAAALLAGGGLIGITAVIAVAYHDSSVSMLMPIIALMVVVPHARGWRLAAFAVPAILAASLAAASPVLPHLLPADSIWDPINAIVGGIIGLVALFLIGWSQIRAREAVTARFEAMVRDLPLAVVRIQEDGRVLDANDAFRQLAGPDRAEVPRLIEAVLAAEPSAGPAAGMWSFELPTSMVPVRGVARWVPPTPDGHRAVEVTLEDLRPMLEARVASDRLAGIVESAGDGILTVDLDDRVLSWNASAERIFGWTADEIVGQPIGRIIPPARRPEHDGWLPRLLAGETISGIETERVHRDGTPRQVVVTLSPLLGPGGSVVGVSAIERDVTEARRMQVRLDADARQRRTVRDALAHLTAGPTVEATADVICETVSGVEAFAHAAVLAFAPDDIASVLSLWIGRQPRPDLRAQINWHAGRSSQALVARAQSGPWTESVTAADSSYRSMLTGAGIEDLAFVPLAVEGEILGLLVTVPRRLGASISDEDLAALADLGAAAAAVIGWQLAARRADEVERQHIELVIRESRFSPVFQPIVELSSRLVVGVEALTRFASGIPPDAAFAAAARLGIGPELEAVTLEAALRHAVALPAAQGLHLNVSPRMVLAGTRLEAILDATSRPIALEITEHEEIPDYEALRAAIARLPRTVHVSVDDAGAGFASLRHILELRPDSVKLDRGLVTGIDGDPARQALIAGMVHFARRAGCTLIAEGVETESERQALLDLGVEHGQGYLFGQPAEVGQHAPTPTGARVERKRPRGVALACPLAAAATSG